ATVRRRTTPLLAAVCVLGLGCRGNYVNVETNRIPVAVARAIDSSGMPAGSSANHGLGPIFPFAGQAVEVTLDGTASHDMDGTIVAYRWLGEALSDPGPGRQPPPGAP